MRKWLSAALAAVLLVLVFAACGGDTSGATDVTYKSATLNGSITFEPGDGPGDLWFEYRADGGEWQETDRVPFPEMTGSGGPAPFSREAKGLDYATHYVFKLCASDERGELCFDSTGAPEGTDFDEFTTDDFPKLTAKSAESFRDSIGVNTKTAYNGTPAWDIDKTKAALLDMGIRHIRDGYWFQGKRADGTIIDNGGWRHQLEGWPVLEDAGIRATVGYGCVTTDLGKVQDAIDDLFARNLDSFVAAWENPNEVNWAHSACPVDGWQTATPTWVRTVHDKLVALGRDDMTIIGPSCGGFHCEDQLGDLSAYVDGGNSHPYRGTGIPETAVEQECPYATQYAPGKPCYITEFGWAVYDWAGGSESVQAAYTLRAFLDYYSKGVPRSFLHQIVDLFPDQENTHEGSFGLYKVDWSPRVAALAIGRMNAFVGDGTSQLASLAYKVEGAPSDFRRVLMRNADGDYVLAVWRQVAAPGGSTPVTFTLPDAVSVKMLRPVGSNPAVDVPLSGDSFTVNVSSEPEFLKVSLD